MYVFHSKFGSGKITHHDIEGGKTQVDFTDHPYGKVEIHAVELNEIQNPYEHFSQLARSFGHNPDNFVILPTVVYRDRMNDDLLTGYDEVVFVPKKIASKVSYVKVNFTMDTITFFDSTHCSLLSTLGLGYADIGSVEAFII